MLLLFEFFLTSLQIAAVTCFIVIQACFVGQPASSLHHRSYMFWNCRFSLQYGQLVMRLSLCLRSPLLSNSSRRFEQDLHLCAQLATCVIVCITSARQLSVL